MTLMANGKKVLGYALGDTEFYSIDGSDTSVNANGKTYYAIDGSDTSVNANGKTYYAIDGSDTSVNANGKTYYAVPSKITIKEGTYITYPFPNSNVQNVTEELQKDFEVDCVGANDANYFFVGYLGAASVTYTFQEKEGCGVGEVLKSDCTNIVW